MKFCRWGVSDMGLTLPFPCCFAITAGRAGSKHCHTSAAPGTPRGVCVCIYMSYWHNTLCLISALWNIGDDQMGNALLQAVSPIVFHHLLDKTCVIAQKQSAISPLPSLPLSQKSYLCLLGTPQMRFHMLLEVAVLPQYSYHFYSHESPGSLSFGKLNLEKRTTTLFDLKTSVSKCNTRQEDSPDAT